MRNLLIILIVMCSIKTFGQWAGTNPVYFNGGNVGIGTSAPAALLDIKYSGFNNLYRATDQMVNTDEGLTKPIICC